MASWGPLLLVAARFAAAAAGASAALLLLGVGVLVGLQACVVGKAFLRARRAAAAAAAAVLPALSVDGLSPDELRALPCYEFGGFPSGGTDDDDCAVCLERFGVRERCRLLPVCGHIFHAQCVDPWLLAAPLCPICRTSAAPPAPAATTTKHG